MHNKKKDNGFTVIDCLITVAILAVLTSLLAPGMQGIFHAQQGEKVLRQIADAIFMARTMAARTGQLITLCPSSSGTKCEGQWHEGTIVFVDNDQNHQPGAGEELLSYIQFPALPGTLTWRAFRNRKYLQITPQGFTRYQNGNFTWCSEVDPARNARQLIVNRTGRVRFALDSDGDGFRENSKGLPISCP